MYKTNNLMGLRTLLLGAIALLSLSLSACCFAPLEADATMDAEAPEEPMMEEASTDEMMSEMMETEPLVVADDIHIVATGESLWMISGMTSIYNDAFRWPLIYRNNLTIVDADLIFPGQELAVPRDLTRADIDAAVTHAKNRGAWSLFDIEGIDLQYRNTSM